MIPHEDANEASSSSSFVVISSPVDSIQAFSVDHIPFLASMLSHTGAPLNHSPLTIFIGSGVYKISQKIHISIPNPFKLSRGCYLFFEPFNSTSAVSVLNRSMVFLLSGP